MAIMDKDDTTKGISTLKGTTIKSLIEKTNFSHVKVRATIKMYCEYGVVAEGFKDRNSKTYYITKKGLELLREIKSN